MISDSCKLIFGFRKAFLFFKTLQASLGISGFEIDHCNTDTSMNAHFPPRTALCCYQMKWNNIILLPPSQPSFFLAA